MRAAVASGLVLVAAMCAVACDSDTGRPEPTSSSPSPAAGPAMFDSCTEIDNATLVKMGLDPAVKKTSPLSQGVGSSMHGCTFASPEQERKVRVKRVTIVDNHVTTFDDQKKRWAPTAKPPFSINGRESLMSVNEVNSGGSCLVVMRQGTGALFIEQSIELGIQKTGFPPCDGMPEMAKIIEPLLPKGN